MRTLLSTTTFLTPLAFAFAFLPAAAMAQTSISTAVTSPVRTSSAGDVTVTSTGSITINGGPAIAVDSNNSSSNAGTITQGNANGAVGIDVSSGTSGTISNSGTISITENFVPAVADGSAIVSGPTAQASDRAGIWVRGGGVHNGDITGTTTSVITVEGLNSYGIRVDDVLNGTLHPMGAITVTGDNSVGVQAGTVTGNVAIDSRVTVIGAGSTAVNLTGDVGGMVRLQNTIGQQMSYADDAGTTLTLPRATLRLDTPAVIIAGNVGGGILIGIPPTTTSTSNTDQNGNGVTDSDEGSGALQSYGSGPALLIGGATDTVISPVSGNGHALVIDGTVTSNAYYSNTDSIAIQIGGKGGNVTLSGGISVTGQVHATTNDAQATAILINAGSHVPVIDNTGSIVASISSPGEGAVYGIRDLSGSLTTINTTGFITASATSEDITDAIDVSANTSGVTINQSAPADTDTSTTTDSTTVTTQITGNIITGSGNDALNVSYGVVQGNSVLGAGDDSIALSGSAVYKGKADFGTGAATMTLADTAQFIGTAIFNDQPAALTLGGTSLFQGGITGGAHLAVTVNGGTLEASGVSNVAFDSLTVNSGGTLKVAVDGDNHTSPQFNVRTATFASGSHVAASVSSLAEAEGSYVILTANQINGAPDFSTENADLPFLYKGTVNVDAAAGEVSLTIARKDAQELGLNRAQAAAYPAILAAAPADSQVETSLLQATDGATLRGQFDGLLPDHAGGNFDLLTRGSRMATRHLTNNNTMFDNISNVGGWMEFLKWDGNKDAGATSGYTTGGWGLSTGLERKTGIGHVGLSFDWLSGNNKTNNDLNGVDSNTYEFGAFWRTSHGPFYAFARASIGLASFSSSRTFSGTVDDTDFTRAATASWKGTLYSGTAGLSYQFDRGDHLSFKPMVVVDYYRLHENGYTETGAAQTDGGDAMDLTVAGRTSDAAAATTTLTGIYRFGVRSADGIPLTLEVEAGRRNMIGGALGDTTAHFVNGEDFTITPETVKGGWVAEARLLSGGLDYTWTVSANAEQTNGTPAYGARISLGVAF